MFADYKLEQLNKQYQRQCLYESETRRMLAHIPPEQRDPERNKSTLWAWLTRRMV
ncbi:MAG: hypothetical protein OHK0046_00700 [Anaerolineae bacterium]